MKQLRFKNKTILLLIICFILAGIFIISGKFISNNRQTENDNLLKKVPQIKTLPQEEQQEVIAAVGRGGELEMCEYASGITINGEDYYVICKNNVLLREALEKQSFAVCDAADGNYFSKDDCINQVLMRSIGTAQNPQICANSPTEEVKKNCYTLYWFNQAVVNDDSKLCLNLEEAESKNKCQDDFGLNKLIDKREEFECSNFTSSDLQSSCRSFDEVISNKDSSIRDCDEISNPQFRNNCVDKIRERL